MIITAERINGRSYTEENASTLLETIVNQVLMKMPGRVFSVREIYQILCEENLYAFSPFAKTPCNSISTRLSTAVNERFPHLFRAERGHYFAA